MALATQCPHCHTTFKVAHDQLKLRSGLVRCGACKQIFNGIENLVAPEQTSPGALPSVSDKQLPAAAGNSIAEPASPSPSLAAPSFPATVPLTPVDEPTHAAPRMPQPGEQSAINDLEFIPVDDPETQTRILAPESPPDQAPARQLGPASEPHPIDDDPLTRMTLVDFSMFEEDIAKAEAPGTAEATPPPAPSMQDIWPDTKEQIEPEADFETTSPGKQEAAETGLETALPASASVPEPMPEADTQPLQITDEDKPLSVNTEPDFRSDATTIGMTDAMLTHDIDTAVSAEAEPAPSTIATSTVMEEHEYGGNEIAVLSPADKEEEEEPSFVTGERRRQRRRRAMRIFMAIASILLFAAVLLQAAYAFRNQLAVRFPQAKPLLSQLCELAGCQVLLPAQIDQVSIESNELQMAAANKNVFTLSLLLHNRSSVPQAWPHIELTLNDKDGKALVRRVMTPKEYLPADKGLAEGIAARSEQAVNVSFELNQLQASDYRVYLFYP